MYMKRRSPDTLEVQQMREQKKESDRHKAKNREILLREIKAREEMEKSREETLVKYRELQAEMEKYKTDLDEARRTIEDLERQLRELQVSNFSFTYLHRLLLGVRGGLLGRWNYWMACR